MPCESNGLKKTNLGLNRNEGQILLKEAVGYVSNNDPNSDTVSFLYSDQLMKRRLFSMFFINFRCFYKKRLQIQLKHFSLLLASGVLK